MERADWLARQFDDVEFLADSLQLPASALTLLVAPAASLAGTVQVVGRSLETALHKLHELGFDLRLVRSGFGCAPVPPPSATEIGAIGRANDAILYGGRVLLWVSAGDATIARIGPAVPSLASPDYGQPFAALYERYGGDFYRIDPLLFSPAEIVFHNVRTGQSQCFGRLNPEVLQRSFFAAS